jgi:hypothetical protein
MQIINDFVSVGCGVRLLVVRLVVVVYIVRI